MRVGTASARRRAQLLALEPELSIEPLRGNVDTRLRKRGERGLDAIVLAAAGLGLLPCAAFIALVATRPTMPRAAVWAIIVLNALWVVGSVLLLTHGGLAPTALGYAFVLGQAAVVALLAELEYLGLRRG